MADLASVISDLSDEHDSLDPIVAALDEAGWDTPTPAEPWTVRDQISHLAFFDEQALLAVSEPDEFAAGLGEIAKDLQGFVDGPIERGRSMSGAEVLGWWREARARMLESFRALDPNVRVPWYGPPMSPASFVTARIMETWAHGQDVVDALGVDRAPTERLRNVCHIGVRARNFSYATHGMETPTDPVTVELRAPNGDTWSWYEGSADRITGSALGFCLVVTQRRHPDDTDVVAEGPLAKEWLSIAQAFAGPPGGGRKPGQFEKVTG
jgi:uncharacterized protein (TIGR03084 family)